MKKLLLILLVVCSMLILASCNTLDGLMKDLGVDSTLPDTDNTTTDPEVLPTPDQNENEDGADEGDQPGDDNDEEDGNKPGDDDVNDSKYTYTDFTAAEKSLFNSWFEFAIPFLPNNEYYAEEYEYEYEDYSYEDGVNFYTYGNTKAEFLEYLKLFDVYDFDGSEDDEFGDTWYYYSKGDVYIDLGYYYSEDDDAYIADVYVYYYYEDGDSGNTGGGSNDNDDDVNETKPTYTDFTAEEKSLFNSWFEFVIPFLPNDEYTVEEYEYEYEDYSYEMGISFYTFGNTKAEFLEYLKLFDVYDFDGSEDDEFGDTWYYYSKGDVYIDLSYYYSDKHSKYVTDVYVYYYYEDGDSGNTGGGSNDNDDENDETKPTYTDFTAEEKALFNSWFGFVIPFLPNNEYYVDEYEVPHDDNSYEEGVSFYTVNNTEAQFLEYLKLFDDYTFDDYDVDQYGDTWYYYSKGDVYIDLAYYYDDYYDEYITDVYVYYYYEDGNSGNTGSGSQTDYDVITNEGAGLPTDSDGVLDVDFTDAENVKNVTEQGYYLDGCPTTGNPGVLVIPVDFMDATAESKGYSTAVLSEVFKMSGKTDYYSVYDYYYLSSYGQLELDVTVLDFWFRPQFSSEYYENATYDYYGNEIAIGDQLILDEALAYLESRMDLSKFDSDGNGTIDAVVLVNTLDIGNDDFHWAYRYWNVYVDENEEYFVYDGVNANDYVWASYQFIQESYDQLGNTYYDENTVNPYTFIHEFGHVLGTDDYYDTEGVFDPLYGYDVMDAMQGDQNAYTKFNLGWLTTSRLVVTDGTLTLTLEAFTKNGDTIILATNWDEKLGAYQEYYVITYYTNTVLNTNGGGYFDEEGLLVYHVNASLYKEEIDGEVYYDVYNSNTHVSSEYGTEDNLIELVKSADGDMIYGVGESLGALTDDLGNELGYTFTVDSITGDVITITFSAK